MSRTRLKFVAVILFFFVFDLPKGNAQDQKSIVPKPTLSILSLPSSLDAKWVEQFERENNAAIRVEFVTNSNGFEPRIRSTPRAWDLILADERHLRSLVSSRLLKPLPSDIKIQSNQTHPLEKLPAMSDDRHMYLLFAADVFGMAWLKDTRKAPLPVQWSWLLDSQKNPLWRGRMHIPSSLNFQYRIAAMATQTPIETENTKPIVDWLKAVHSHVVESPERLEMHLLSNEIAATLLWKSDFNALKKIVKDLEFGIPQSGTFFERLGFAYIGESSNEDLATKFLNFVAKHRNDFADAVGLIPLAQDYELQSTTKSWSLIEDEDSLPAKALAEIKKISGAE